MHRRTVIRGLAAIAAGLAVGDAVVLRRSGRGDVARSGGDAAGSGAGGSGAAGVDQGASLEPRAAEPARPSGREADTGPTTAPVALTVVCRRDWGAQAPRSGFHSHQIGLLTVHHTGVVHRDPAEGPARVRGHQRHHLDAGLADLADLAYHFVVDAAGIVYEGRPVEAVGETFTEYDPTGHFLPCLEGDFGRQEPAPAQVAVLLDLLAWAAGTFDVDPATIAGHRAYAATACPGDHLQRLVDDGTLRRGVEDRLARGGVRLERTC